MEENASSPKISVHQGKEGENEVMRSYLNTGA